MSRLASGTGLETRPKRGPARLDRPHVEGVTQPPRRRTGVVPWGFVGMIALVAAAEWNVSGRWRELSDPTSLSWQFADRAARHEAAGRDVLFLGDSLVKHGLVPSVFESESGLRSVNLSAARAPALLSYFVLRRAIESGARPSAIVIDTKPAVLIGGVDYNAHYWPAALTARECLELGWMAGKRPLGFAAMAARLIPSLQSRLEIRSGIAATLEGRSDPIPEINRLLGRNWTVNEGANVAMMHSPYQGELDEDIREKLHPDRWHVDEANALGLERLLKLAAQHRIRVFWLLPPISPGLQEWRERSGSEAKYEKFVRSYVARYPRFVAVLDGRRIIREASLYVDATHLSGRGAVALSRAVGAAIKAESEGRSADRGGWIVLDEPDPAPEPPLEDVERSKQIVQGIH